MQVSNLLFTKSAANALQSWCHEKGFESIYFLCDTNTYQYCYPVFKEISDKVIVIPSGETHKQLRMIETIIEQLVAFGAKQNHLLVNLGGGVVTDIGGFAASIYRRGMKCINVPTTLMAMADAAIGGKTGVDHQHLKNYIGTFYQAEMVLISTEFLATLPYEEFISAWAEMIKTGAILDAGLFKMIEEDALLDDILKRCAECKQSVVQMDVFDRSHRQLLNFGHTIGHAYESHYLNISRPVKHGIAVAKGMMAELEIAKTSGYLTETEATRIQSLIQTKMSVEPMTLAEWTEVKKLLWADKKNTGTDITFSLPVAIGKGKFGIKMKEEEIKI
jgi:3-dehydroquinate synthase